MLRFVFAALVAAALIACPSAMAQSADCSTPADSATASSSGDSSTTPPGTPDDDSTSGGATASPSDGGSGGSGGATAGSSGSATTGSSGGATTRLASSDTSDRPAVMLADSGGSGDVRAQASQPEPEQPGQEQPGTGQPGNEQPGTGTPGTEQPGTGGGFLPRTGLDALRLFAIGLILLLVGARLRVLTRIREIPRRIAARRRRTDVALREAVENLRQPQPGSDWEFPDPEAPAPMGVLPSTAVGRRTAGMTGGDPSPAG